MPIIQLLARDDTQIIYGLSLRARLSEAVNHILLVDDLSNHGLLLSVVAMLIVVILTAVTGEVDIPISPIPLILAIGFFIVFIAMMIGLPLFRARHPNRLILNLKDGTIAIDKKGKLTIYTPAQITKIRYGGISTIIYAIDNSLYNLSTYDDDLIEAIRSNLLKLLPDVLIESDRPSDNSD